MKTKVGGATVKPSRYLPSDDGTPTTQEHRIADRLGGKRVPGSGATPYAKGDVKIPQFLVECKQTEKKSLSIKYEWLEKISAEAARIGQEPMLTIEIKGGSRDSRAAGICDRDWVLLPARVFREMTEGEND